MRLANKDEPTVSWSGAARDPSALAIEASAFPRVVGPYALYGVIASGGMATVHFGRLLGPGGFARPVAIKRLHPQFARDPAFIAMFLDEARLASRVTHPNVVQTLDVVAAADEVFLVMEYVHGATLAQLTRTVRSRGERFQPLVSIGIVSAILQGLHAAHEAKDAFGKRLDLIHRDVSPDNTLVGADGVARLLDFGVAKASARLQSTRDGQLKGKLAYMAPEQACGEPLTRRTDVFAASVVLWEVLTAKRLFCAENDADVLSRVLTADVPPPSSIVPDLPRSLDLVVLKGLARDPAKRYATAREMAADLDGCIGVASPTEIGDWVGRTVGEELRARASRLATLERLAAEAAGELPERASRPGLGTLDAATPASVRAYALGTTRAGEETRCEETSAPAASRHRWRALALAVMGGAAAMLTIAVVSSSFTAHAKLSRERPRPEITMEGVFVATPALLLPSTTASSTPGVPSANAQASQLVGAPTTSPPAPLTSSPAAKPGRPIGARAMTPSFGTTSANCNPPYTADAKGHVHFKPDCL